ncbi:trigger factor [Riemerella columbipharyngis]|uniref:Trigger factor n=1 Tax=Riemerella columbipharyngis TaxID=1071918 RepID=A0A1G7A4X5_9FLAO|nr:trigger factor [Riemerella columbipharyngis]SDE09889.1 trigger factor [Riemerella columbipharyngis]
MKVTSKNHDEVSALLTVTLDKKDYKDKVEKQLINYAKNANIPGFRKGKAPLGMIRRQYEGGLTYEEINKQVSEGLDKYITENKIRLIGRPIPVPVEELDTNKEQIEISFEIGYEPDFSIDLSKYEAPHYKVEAGEKEVGKSIENMQKRFADREEQDKATKDSYVALEVKQVVEEDVEGVHNHPPKNVVVSKETKEAFELVKKLKKDESLEISKEDIQKDENLAKQLGFSKDEAEHLHHDKLSVTVKDIYKLNLAELNQELFNKVYGEGEIKSEEELKAKVKSELDEYFQQNADIHFVNKILEQITEKEEVKLPEEFLVKWLMFSNENINTKEQAEEVYAAEKNALKYQVIESKLISDNGVSIDYTDLLSQAEQLVRNQLAIYGIHHLPDEEVQKYAVEMMKNQEQVRQISSEVAMAKLRDVILEKAAKKEEKISHDDFMKKIEE